MKNKIVQILLLLILISCPELVLAAKRIRLKKPDINSGLTLNKSLNLFKSRRRYTNEPMDLLNVSEILWAAAGDKIEGITGASRTYPSAGAIYPLSFYLVAVSIKEIQKGVYLYDEKSHSLIMKKKGDFTKELFNACYNQSMIIKAPVIIIMTLNIPSVKNRYGEKGVLFAYQDSGHSGQNIYLSTESQGLGTVAVGAFDQNKLHSVLGLSSDELPIYLFPVGHYIKK